MPIPLQQLAVSQYVDNERREALRYAPGNLADGEGQAPLPIHHSVHLERVTTIIGQVRDVVRRLTDLAADGLPRGTVDVGIPAAKLAQLIMPPGGFVSLVGPDWHPQLDLAGDIGGEIPWEVLEEHYGLCRCRGDVTHQPIVPTAPLPPCPHCHQPLQAGGGKLAIERHLTQLVRYSRRCALGQGRDFLLVIDPKGDLLTPEADPTGKCREHVTKLETMLKGAGFNVIKVQRKFATVDKIETELKSTTLVGLYYFGHGEPPERKRAGSLVLADGPLFADDIAGLDATPRVAFLNACWGGRGGAHADWDNRPSGVGEALARGGRKVVVASLFPVVNVHAARTALTFFERALAGDPLAVALQQCRRESYSQYVAGEPNVGWMAYRYFGDPNLLLPKAELPPVVTSDAPGGPSVFDENERLVADQFGNDLRAILLRAASRRQRQRRGLVTVQDLFAGLLRVGQLVRLCWRDQGRNADADYEQLRDAKDPEAVPATPAPEPEEDESADASEKLWKLIAQWIVRQRCEFSPGVLELFDVASRIAASEGRATGDHRVTEFDLLRALCQPGLAARLPGFPAAAVANWLEAFRRQKLFDDNGFLRLDDLEPGARRIIERAHELAQQRGQKYIPSRLLLAAFLQEEDGIGARLVQQLGAKPSMLRLLLIAMTKGETPENFPLSLESCGRIVLPALKEAGLSHIQPANAPITEEQLFRAFCRVAPPELKRLFGPPHFPIRVDFDVLATLPLSDDLIEPDSIDPDPDPDPPIVPEEKPPRPPEPAGGVSFNLEKFDEGGRRAVTAAAEFARAQGSREIRSPHLFAGLLTRPGLLTETLEVQQINPGEAIAAALRTVVPQSAPDAARHSVQISINVSSWFQAAAAVARRVGADRIGERHLTEALFAKPSQVLRHVLQHFRVEAAIEPAHPRIGDAPPKINLDARNWDLTALARRGSLPPFVSRDDLLQAFQSQLVPQQARVVLLGNSGVGKTSLAHGLAQAIVAETCGPDLRDCRVIEVSARDLSGQGRFPSEGWARLQTMLSTLPANVILFLDDLFPGWLPAPELGQFDWRSCPARVTIVTEPAAVAALGLHSFQTIQVPPATYAARAIVEAARPGLAKRFRIGIPPETGQAACELATAEHLPGSAIQLLIQSCLRHSGGKFPIVLGKEMLEIRPLP